MRTKTSRVEDLGGKGLLGPQGGQGLLGHANDMQCCRSG